MAVRWYLPRTPSHRDVEELLAERGIVVDHVSVYRWVERFTPLRIDAARPCRHIPGDQWFVDETYIKVSGRWSICTGRSTSSARSSTCLCPRDGISQLPTSSSPMRSHGSSPTEVTTDPAPAYPRVLDELVPAANHARDATDQRCQESLHGCQCDGAVTG